MTSPSLGASNEPRLDLRSIPISDWLREGEKTEIPWRLHVTEPTLRMDQRVEVSFTARVRARDLKHPEGADVFINVPKLKTHCKAGVTVALKNLVGICNEKRWLPHHRKGAPDKGGDEYSDRAGLGIRTVEALKDFFVQNRVGKIFYPRIMLLNKLVKRITGVDLVRRIRDHGDPYQNGGWHGNDTVWRMVLDLNKCSGCQTCTVACKVLNTNDRGMDHVWLMKVNTSPGRGYPKDWETMGGGFDEAGLPMAGVMVEVPSAALRATDILASAEFASIGTNDLIQYTLAIDRTDDTVAHLYDPLHPAVLHLLAHVIRSAGRAGVPVALCGEMAGDVSLTRLLLALGLRNYSMHTAHLLDVKQVILKTDCSRLRPLVQRMLRTSDPEKLHALLEKLNA